jgi:HD-GYP domain-containing protein (c-di-GMP phosphodiesterase class II)
MRFWDLNKKLKNFGEKSENLKKEERIEKMDKEIDHQKTEIEKDKIQKNKEIRFSIKKTEEKRISFDEEMSFKKSSDSYSVMISSMKNIINYIQDSSYVAASKEIEMLCDLISREVKENRYILNFLKYLTPKNYIISHSVNLSIIVGGISYHLGFDDELTRKLIISSLCIDLGMLNYKELFLLERKFNREEFEIIKSHIDDGIEIVDKLFAFEIELKDFVREIIKNSHERYDGSGYFGFKGDELDIRHQIVAIADVYEAMTHKRPWRDSFEKPYAVSYILRNSQNSFERNAVKGFVNFMCIYPESSIVKLSTGEIVRVILNKPSTPTRPLVKVLMNEEFVEVDPYVIDLSDFPLTYIDGWVSSKELKMKNPDFYRKERISELWIEL